MASKKYWKSEAELNPNDAIVETLGQNEFPEEIPVDEFLGDKENLSASTTNRRDFLKYVGFSTAAASLAACEGPVRKSIPYVVKPEQIIPGVANYYATTIADGYDFASILIKTREGRPIKVENNKDAATKGNSNARIQASVLSLYDSTRLQGPLANGEPIEWAALDTAVKGKLGAFKATGKQIALLTQTYASPSTAKLVAEFKEFYGNVNHITYDAISEDAALSAFEARFGERALPSYDFEKAEVIVSFGADFLGDWQGGGFDSGYSKGRIPKNGKMSRHIQFESNMSLTGANADKRIPLKPSEQKKALASLFGKLNNSSVNVDLSDTINKAVDDVVAEIKNAGKNAVVVTGLDDVNAQAVTLSINEMLASSAFDPTAPRYIRQGNTKTVNALIKDMNSGKVGALIMDGVNPMYTLPNASEFAEGVAKVDLSVTFSTNWNETTEITEFTAASNHYLESWGDAQFVKGHYSLMQPTIKELFDTRQFQQALLQWMDSDLSYYDYLKETWSTGVLGEASWNKALHDGVFSMKADSTDDSSAPNDDSAAQTMDEQSEGDSSVAPISAAISTLSSSSADGMELVLYPKTGMGDGKQANNPWLQEFPDPISRVSWDNYVCVSRADASTLGFVNENVANGGLNGSYARLTVNGVSLENVPVIIQPGQAAGTLGLSFGYGRQVGMKAEMQTGVNAYTLYQGFSNIQNVTIEKASGTHEFACVQLHNTLMGRGDIIKETTLEIFNTKDHSEWNHVPQVSLNHQEVPATTVDLWDSFDRSIGHHFNMSIDLNACTGCGACVIACHAENNVPVVGKEEVRKSRDMHWLRIDRYYSSEDSFDQDNIKKDEFSGISETKSGFEEMELAAVNPQVAFQPVMCQHCNHAPCETVCPVAATSHSRQGQNHMAYNRCVGTRYCANNCPYKVRRFNWFLLNNNDEFDYHFNNDLGKMVINPDVTVRSRGVIEKCSLCIQMTQKTILDAKREGREIVDGEFQTACSNACSNGAIVFGDSNDEESQVTELKKNDRMYHLLESVGTKPNVFYHVKVRNTNKA
ncbi:TAT-variant-translocated molybdopterin oxidoreductase [uncultured Eudoraea sp.]|uniref:TAT-variant-translocated molybdopterin oxidoreductase n=1 Tax=uncultured Eudoraea sp. TaxID=1035614 RepID=UPI00261A8CF1|nr:TAT-variant-translocated molybdopterin oxidoreductase [uncultured Eudoraea sp.]